MQTDFFRRYFKTAACYEYENWKRQRTRVHCLHRRYLTRLEQSLELKLADETAPQDPYESDLQAAEINCLRFDIEHLKAEPVEVFAVRNGLPYLSFGSLSKQAKAYAFCRFAAARADSEDHARPDIEIFMTELAAAVVGYVDAFPYSCSESSCFDKDFSSGGSFKQILECSRQYVNNLPQVKHVSLTRYFKRYFADEYRGIKQILDNCAVSRRAGNLPPQWLRLLKEQGADIRAKTIEIDEILSRFAADTFSSPYAGIRQAVLKKLGADLSAALTAPVTVEMLGRGQIKKVFKISAPAGAVVLSTNHNQQLYNSVYANHGNTKETALGLYISNSSARRDYVRTYMGRIGLDGQADTYGLTEFVGKDPSYRENSKETMRFEKRAPGLIYDSSYIVNLDDTDENRINGIFVDVGGAAMCEDLKDRKMLVMVNQIFRALKTDNFQWAEKLENYYEKRDKKRWRQAKEIAGKKILSFDSRGPLRTAQVLQMSPCGQAQRVKQPVPLLQISFPVKNA